MPAAVEFFGIAGDDFEVRSRGVIEAGGETTYTSWSPVVGFEVKDLPGHWSGTKDYDLDNDGLIEIASRSELDAVRWDNNGDGGPEQSTNLLEYGQALPNAVVGMGCPFSGCTGYELTADLDFDSNGNGQADIGDDYWGYGESWVPLGSRTTLMRRPSAPWRIPSLEAMDGFTATFEGNGHVIRNLYVDAEQAGLFSEISRHAVIRNVGLEGVNVDTGFDQNDSGGLVALNRGSIRNSYVSGVVAGQGLVGGLVGFSGPYSSILHSYSTASVSGTYDTLVQGGIGGLVGVNRGSVLGSYATGPVTSTGAPAGGLVGGNGNLIRASYSTGEVSTSAVGGGLVGVNGGTVSDSYWNTESSNMATSAGGSGKTEAELVEPTGYDDLYANWNVNLDGTVGDPWDFGSETEYPVLKVAGPSVGEQRGLPAESDTPPPGPVLNLAWTAKPHRLILTWEAPDSGGAPTGYIVHVKAEGGKKGSGKTKRPKAEKTSVTFKKLEAGQTYKVWVRAKNDGGKGERVHATITLPTE